MLRISTDPIDTSLELRQFEVLADRAGGIVTFSGQVRPHASKGAVTTLLLQAYSPLTENGIESAIAEARTKWALDQVLVLHRTGEMSPGDTIVFVATASKHRRAAFEAADFLMDYLKTEAVFWKKEKTETGAYWIEPRDEDYKDAARWAEKEPV
ncbi:MAG: molybdenum cofactor biosynthesis protein MoaE [Pseudomonadota bacterium]